MDNLTYKHYKDSGVEWLGEIPINWEMMKMKYVCDINTGSKDTQDNDVEGVYPFFVRSDTVERINEFTHNEEAVMTAGDGVGVGRVFHYFKGRFAAHQRVYVFTNFRNISGKFLYYYLQSNLAFEVLRSNAKSTVDSLRRPMLANFIIALPSIDEQKRIIDFLEVQIAKIKSFIELKKQQIETLEKYRQSLITEIVTKGLDHSVKMKDSGIEWIGKIPEHWNVKRLGFLGSLQNGISKSSENFGFGYPFVSYGDVYKNIELPHEVMGLVNSSRSDRRNYSVKKGDVFFTRTSETVDEIGFASTCLETIDDATFAGFLIRFRPRTNNLIPSYSKYYFRSEIHRRYFVKEMNIVTRASLGQELLKKLPVILPSQEEQKQIADFLDEKLGNIEELIKQNQQLIKKLEKYSQALVYEAVTGKINVRNYKEIELEVEEC